MKNEGLILVAASGAVGLGLLFVAKHLADAWLVDAKKAAHEEAKTANPMSSITDFAKTLIPKAGK